MSQDNAVGHIGNTQLYIQFDIFCGFRHLQLGSIFEHIPCGEEVPALLSNFSDGLLPPMTITGKLD